MPSAQLMELHHLFFHPKKEVETAECTLEENVEGGQEELGKQNQGEGADDVCQLCDQPLPPPISLADHLLAEHDVSIPLLLLVSMLCSQVRLVEEEGGEEKNPAALTCHHCQVFETFTCSL